MSSHSSYKEFLRKWAPLMVLLLLCTIISVIYPGFLSVRNFSRLLTASAAPLMIAIGVTFIIIMGSEEQSEEISPRFCYLKSEGGKNGTINRRRLARYLV